MTWQSVEAIADALLYEGYLLYPYRRSAIKNRYRWQFGVVAPRAYSDAGGVEPSLMQTECLVETRGRATLAVKVRFLQVEARQVQIPAGRAHRWRAVDSVQVDGRELSTWEEAVPREIALAAMSLDDTTEHVFEIAGGEDTEEFRDRTGKLCARVVRERLPLTGVVTVSIRRADGCHRVSVRIENTTRWTPDSGSDRATVMRRSLVATHTLLSVRHGAFISQLDPPAHAAAAAAACCNVHTWPVLAGAAPQRDLMLSSPIILYDYPQVAPESTGDMFDGTEIDELLTLSVLALSDAERMQARTTDPRAGTIVERSAQLHGAQLERVHGAIRRFEPVSPPAAAALEAWLNPPGSDTHETTDVAGKRIAQGSRVRLLPRRQADAMDMFLTTQTATVAAVYRDLEDEEHIAVIVDAGDAVDLHEAHGRYFYFRPDEVEALDNGADASTPSPIVGTRVLVAGIGNMFLGDDGFGSAVVQRLRARGVPAAVRVEDFGIRSVHLAYDLIDAPYDATILVDAVARGGAPGTLYVIEPDVEDVPAAPTDGHDLDVGGVLSLLKRVGAKPGRIYIVGCEPLSVAPGIGLSEVVAAAIDGAADLVSDVITTIGE